MSTFEIYFNDLNEEAQQRYIDQFGFNENHELSPLSIIEIEDEEIDTHFVFTNAITGEVLTRIAAKNINQAFGKFVKSITTSVKHSQLFKQPDNKIYIASGEIVCEDDSKLRVLIR